MEQERQINSYKFIDLKMKNIGENELIVHDNLISLLDFSSYHQTKYDKIRWCLVVKMFLNGK